MDPRSAEAVTVDATFKTTHWSTIVNAGGTDCDPARNALASLCATYWYPLYVYVRRQGHNPDDAQDLVQGFFAQAIEKAYFSAADPEKGRFRSFLLLTLKRYMANEHAKASRQKRGGGVQLVSIDVEETETRYKAEPVDPMTPEKAYDRRWAETVLRRVLDHLGNEFVVAGKGKTFEALKMCLDGDRRGTSYAQLGEELDMSEGAIAVAVHRLRQRYRDLLRREIAQTVATPEMVDEEIQQLFQALE